MTVYVKVERSTRAPRFDDAPFADVRVPESTRVGENIFQFKAHDPDLQGTLTFDLIGDYPAPSFFRLDPESGQLSIAKDLKSDNLKSEEYTVSTEEKDLYI